MNTFFKEIEVIGTENIPKVLKNQKILFFIYFLGWSSYLLRQP